MAVNPARRQRYVPWEPDTQFKAFFNNLRKGTVIPDLEEGGTRVSVNPMKFSSTKKVKKPASSKGKVTKKTKGKTPSKKKSSKPRKKSKVKTDKKVANHTF